MKCRVLSCRFCGEPVAPHWGAWIEMLMLAAVEGSNLSRTPLGCVD